ncbi:MAG: HAMP domain-containing sensor histidine kinase, partial [Cyanobacteria bacterium J06635_1]
SKPSRQLIIDLSFWSATAIVATAAIGWLLSGLAMAPVRDSYQQLKQFTADASHELRNPIAVIQTNVQVALSDPEPDVDFQQNQLQVIERLTRRLGRLVDNLLFLTRQDSGLVPMQRDPIDLATLLNEVVEEQQAIAQEKHITLGYQPDDSVQYPLSGDRDQLIRLFTNLIANALLYTPSDGCIQVGLHPTKLPGGVSYQITVQDTGIGIEAEALAHVFDRFYRVDPARSRRSERGDGSGLGLAIAKAIVTNHQGQINITSEPGIGTTVKVLLPQK